MADRYRKNVRFAVNAFIQHDPRDADIKDEEKKATGKVRLYEFPATLEKKISNELTNEEEGYGQKIFDPEDGNDFVISVAAKAKDENGKVWPDYTLTQFSRKRNAIAETDEEIEKIMNSVYDLSEYLDKMSMDWSVHEKLLKQEMVWDYVEDAFIKNVKTKSDDNKDEVEDAIKRENEDLKEKEQEKSENEDSSSETESKENDQNSEEDDDQELIKELRNL